MRIAVDARELEGRPTGVGRYLGGLLRSWLAAGGSERFLLYHRGELQYPDWANGESVEFRLPPRGLVPAGAYWEQVVLPRALRRDRPDVLFAPAGTLPLSWRGPSVLTVLDLSFEAHPEWFGYRERWRRRLLARASARRADLILAISRFTKGEVLSRYRVPADSVRVVHLGVDDSLREAPFTPEAELRERIGFSGPLALMVGSIFERRFPLRCIGAFRHLRDAGIGLVIAGDDRRRRRSDLRAEIREMGLADRVFWLRYCPEEDLCGLLRCARLVLYLSSYEGFGLPPLEAMSFGVPAVVSARGALREVYEGAALMVENESEEAIAAAVRSLDADGDLRDGLVEAGERLVREFTLERCAARTLESILKTAQGGGGGGR